jgi:hydroxymethylbilane synthase
LGLECRADDVVTASMVASIDDTPSRLATTAERAAMAALHGGCSAPIGAWGRLVDSALHLDVVVVSVDGRQVLRGGGTVDIEEADSEAAVELGRRVAAKLHEQGAAALIAESRGM